MSAPGESPWQRLRALGVRLLQALDRQRKGLRQLGHAGVFLLLMLAATRLIEPLKPLDWRLLEALDRGAPAWPGSVALIDLGWDMDPAGLPCFRENLAGAIDALAALPAPPRLLVLDVRVDTVPIGLEELRQALDRLHGSHKGLQVVQAASLRDFPHGASRNAGLLQQGLKVLHAGGRDARYGHAVFGYDDSGDEPGRPPAERPGRKAWYARCEAIPTLPGAPGLPAIATLVAAAQDANRPGLVPQCTAGTPGVLAAPELPVIFTPGAARPPRGQLWCLQRGAGLVAAEGGPSCPVTDARSCPAPRPQPLPAIAAEAEAATALANQVVIIGNLAHDRVGPWAGPVLLAWAIGEAGEPFDAAHPLLADDPRLALLTMLLFSGLTLAMVALLRRRGAGHAAPALTALGGGLLALLLLAGMVLGLRHGLHIAFFQLSYVVIGIVLSALLAWHAMAQTLRRRALYTSVSDTPEDAAPDWDVFLSYSHSPAANIERVRRELFEPLSRLRTADDEQRPLRVFFDESSIRIGTSWYLRLATGIEGSRCFVALYSNDYFRKDFCRFELTKAVVRDIARQSQGRVFKLLPFLLDAQALPPAEFSHLQYVDETPEKRIETIRAALREIGLETF